MRDAGTLTRPAFAMPGERCDSHVHVFEAAAKYPSVDAPHYTLPDGSLQKLQRMADALALQRFIIVQPSYYGTDNSCMLDALSAAGGRARGVAMVAENCSDEELIAMHARGVRALRLDLFLRSTWPHRRHHRLYRTLACGAPRQSAGTFNSIRPDGWFAICCHSCRHWTRFRHRSHGVHARERRT